MFVIRFISVVAQLSICEELPSYLHLDNLSSLSIVPCACMGLRLNSTLNRVYDVFLSNWPSV